MNIVGKKIAASGLSANFKQFAITKGMPFVNFALGTIGEGLEEAASFAEYLEIIIKRIVELIF